MAREVEIMKLLDHPNIIKLFQVPWDLAVMAQGGKGGGWGGGGVQGGGEVVQ